MFSLLHNDAYHIECLAWDLALESWPAPAAEQVETWIPSGLRSLDLGDRVIGRRWVLYPFYGYRREVGLGPAALWIRFGSEWSTGNPKTLGILYRELIANADLQTFGFMNNPYWRLRLTSDAAGELRKRLEMTP